MDDIIIRKATIEDLDILLQFEQGVIAAERPFDPTLKVGSINYYDLKEMIDAAHVELLVAASDGAIIGSGYARIEKAKPYLEHDTHAYFGFMYVDPQYRGKGVNKKIMDSLKNWSLSHNVSELRLDVYFGNASAIRAYEKFGFRKHMIEMRFNVKAES